MNMNPWLTQTLLLVSGGVHWFSRLFLVILCGVCLFLCSYLYTGVGRGGTLTGYSNCLPGAMASSYRSEEIGYST